MNLQKYTKAELISKLNGLKSNKNDSEPSFLQKTVEYLFLFKTFLLKITLLTIIIKVFKKYSIFRRIWSIFNTILFTIFGISLIDFYEIEAISKVFHNIIDIYSNFYNNLSELFVKKPNIPVEIPSRMNGIQPKATGIQTGNEESNRIIERFKQLVHKDQEEIITEDNNNPYYKNKYLIIAGMLVLSGLTWYFYDDLKPIGSSILAWMSTLRSRPNPDSGNSTPNIEGPSKSSFQSLKDKVWAKMYEKDDDNLPGPSNLQSWKDSIKNKIYGDDKGKSIDLNNLSLSELERRGFVDHQLTGLAKGIELIDLQNSKLHMQPTGEFINESSSLINEINSFTEKHQARNLGTATQTVLLYNLMRAKLNRLYDLNSLYFNDWIKNDHINDTINDFVSLEKTINSLDDDIAKSDHESETYNEIALATVQEQDIWSDKSPSPKGVLSPEQVLSPLNIHDPIELSDKDIMKAVSDVFAEDVKFKLTVSNADGDQLLSPKAKKLLDSLVADVNPTEAPNNSDDSNNSMDHYFPKKDSPALTPADILIPNPQPEQSKFASLFSQIKSKRVEYGSPVANTPNMGKVGLQTPVEDRLNTSPLIHKSSMTNLFEDTMNLFDEGPMDIGIDTSGDSKSSDGKLEEPIEGDIIPWNEIQVEIDPNDDKFLRIDFKNVKITEGDKILCLTNDGYSNYFTYKFTNDNTFEFKWDKRGNSELKDVKLHRVYVMDKNGDSHLIFSNDTIQSANFYTNLNKKNSYNELGFLKK